jgi:hypothetical protein
VRAQHAQARADAKFQHWEQAFMQRQMAERTTATGKSRKTTRPLKGEKNEAAHFWISCLGTAAARCSPGPFLQSFGW